LALSACVPARFARRRITLFDQDCPQLPIPADAVPISENRYRLTVMQNAAQLLSGPPTTIWGFDGKWPGPTIRVQRGQMVHVEITNDLGLPDENLTIHNHGHQVAADSDGHPVDYIRPGLTKVYEYPNGMIGDMNGATYWYHDHTMDFTGPHLNMGVAGFYIIEDPDEARLNLPSGAYDIPLLIQDRILDATNQLVYARPPAAVQRFFGFHATTPCVNGAITPCLNVETRRYRFRLLNGSDARRYELYLETEQGQRVPIYQIGSDGGLLPRTVKRGTLEFADPERRTVGISIAERIDVVVDFGELSVGTRLVLKNSDQSTGNPEFDSECREIMRFDVTEKVDDPSSLPIDLKPIVAIDPAGAVERELRFSFNGAEQEWKINGLGYDEFAVDFCSQLGDTEIWHIINENSGLFHPVHIHLNQAQILDYNGLQPSLDTDAEEGYKPWLAGWKDTTILPKVNPQRFSYIMRFPDPDYFSGIFVFHCHNLTHEDHRMMRQHSVGCG